MCYAPSVMLRGRGSCAISERPTPLPAVLSLVTSHPPLATAPVSPIIPVHPRNPPVSSIIPVHTQKQGGVPPSDMPNRSISEFSPTLSPQLSRQIFRRHALLCALRALCGESSFFSALSSPNCRFPDKNEKSANIPPWLSITIINNVGAPTYCNLFTTGPSTLKSGPPQKDASGMVRNAVLILRGTGGTGKQFLQIT